MLGVLVVGLILTVIFAFTPRSTTEYQRMFDRTVEVIKKYETLHKARNWPYIGYGHRVLPGEKYKKGVVLSEKEADALLRKDLKKFIGLFKDQGEQAIMLGTLAYNIGPANVRKSKVYTSIKNGISDVRNSYLSHSMYRGKPHNQLRRRRTEEYALFEKLGLVK